VSHALAATRTLVVIELQGGHDGLDTLIPYTNGRYFDLRGDLAVDPATVLDLDGEMGLNASLAAFHARNGAVLEGVGMPDPDLSHFESMRRWWAGDMAGRSTVSTGFLGRLCDQLSQDEPVTGISIGRSAAPALRSETAVTLSVPDLWSGGWLLSEDPLIQAARSGLTAMALSSGESGLADLSRANTTKALDFLDYLQDLSDNDSNDGDTFPGSEIGYQLMTCARLLNSDAGVRVIHVPWGSFDTHDEHRWNHDAQLLELDEALAAFHQRLDESGLGDTTLVATTSEFGRRPEANAAGTDHGTASTMLLSGPVNGGRHGEAPLLGDLDADGNLKATVGFDRYYATLAESWFGVSSADVLPNSPQPISGIITAT
jgi:uncharacterized protein (DUF1501 family)